MLIFFNTFRNLSMQPKFLLKVDLSKSIHSTVTPEPIFMLTIRISSQVDMVKKINIVGLTFFAVVQVSLDISLDHLLAEPLVFL